MINSALAFAAAMELAELMVKAAASFTPEDVHEMLGMKPLTATPSNHVH